MTNCVVLPNVDFIQYHGISLLFFVITGHNWEHNGHNGGDLLADGAEVCGSVFCRP
jgi:hypothetical protein